MSEYYEFNQIAEIAIITANEVIYNKHIISL